ncbi:hypothetical protein [Glaesserella parasuis]|nr:hypothetical protein [Glaesserella parasuis]MDO9758265.1 hypothetical protein [Glaesserella parasuis]MDP0343899.1 hypothetical protein [Glaesserella parasuis]STO81807.1 Uncharacterised protein [Glaesserella parasuis]
MKYNLIAFSLLALPLVTKANPTWVDHQRIKLQEQLASIKTAFECRIW